MTPVVFLRCDYCGAEAAQPFTTTAGARAALGSPALPEAERWERTGNRDVCPDCRSAPEAVGHKTRFVKWLIVHDGEVLGHGVSRRAIVEAVKLDYGRKTDSETSSRPPDRSRYPTFRLAPLEGQDPAEFALECPDGVVLELVSREVAEGYVELCDCRQELHLYAELPRQPIRCWIDLSEGMWRHSYGLYLEGWACPLKTHDDVEALAAFARDHRYGEPEVRVVLDGPRLRIIDGVRAGHSRPRTNGPGLMRFTRRNQP